MSKGDGGPDLEIKRWRPKVKGLSSRFRLPSLSDLKAGRYRVALGITFVALAMVAGLAIQGQLRTNTLTAPNAPDATEDMPTPVPVSEEGLSTLISFAIGGENRVTKVAVTSEAVTVEWAIAERPTSSLRNEGMRHDVSKILEALVFSEVPFRRVLLRGTYAFEEEPGRILRVVQADYNKTTIDGIDFAVEDTHAVLRLADTLALDGRFAM